MSSSDHGLTQRVRIADVIVVPVTQADRDAAADFYQAHLSRPGEVPVANAMRSGEIDDSPLVQLVARTRLSTEVRLGEALKPFAALADEWDRWQAKGSTSTPAMILLMYGRCSFGLPEYQSARDALTTSAAAVVQFEGRR